MLLTITTTHRPATDLGFLLAKNPARCQSFPLAFGQAHVFYPEASEDRCTAALLLDLDPVGLVRRPRGASGEASTLGQYVNDRPYVASSFLSVAIARILGSALKGVTKERAELADTAIPLEAGIPVLPCRGGEPFLRRLFEPLGYSVTARRLPLDDAFPEWGESPYYTVHLTGNCRLRELLTHLYVLLPVLDNDKHYWVGDDELEKLLARGEGWLQSHPEREQIVDRYLKHQRRLVREALERLVADDDPDPETTEAEKTSEEEGLERRISLNEQRIGAVVAALKGVGARRVLDVGCGEGRLLQTLFKERDFSRVVGMDVSHRALEIARERLDLERMPAMQRERIDLFQGALTYRDKRLAGYDALCAIEVIEHLDPSRLPAFERVVFEFARPGHAVLTTPNAEYNVRFESLPAGRFRHRDHRFEWTREQFRTWATAAAGRFGYGVRFLPVGAEDPEVGPPTQMGIFSR
ncbi:MAG TPA: 3' terminal RNA ribose 2'-O-methyltransferase Hen1 [Dongiaceae bacterium]|nr:3' terminal RNA ribose 2'-O-methyltransferase Hen1 [Dongiaceae bacterium]